MKMGFRRESGLLGALLLVSILFVGVKGAAQGKMIYKGDTVNVFDQKGRKHGKWVKTFQGSKDLRLIGNFEHGTPQDTFRYFYRDGTLKAINVFGEEGMVSKVKTYHPSGKLMAKGTYVNKEKNGTWTFYDAKGVKSAIQEYRSGAPHGKEIIFYRNGDTARIRHYKDSTLHGPWKQYFKNGKLKGEGRYKEGLRVGLIKRYHPNGQLKYKGQHDKEKGYRIGEWVWHKENGDLEHRVIYEKGKIDSIIGPDGELISEGAPIDTAELKKPPQKIEQDGPRVNPEQKRFERKRRGRGRRRERP